MPFFVLILFCCFNATSTGTMGPEKDSLLPEVAIETTPGSLEVAFVTSGGGFSNRYKTPSYQNAQISAYLNFLDTVSVSVTVGFNQSGRAYPDVSSMAHNVLFALGGQLVPYDSTAASVPTFAAFVSLINSHRKGSGMSTLGFMNPLLYSTADAWIKNDIVVGSNRCTAYHGSAPVCCDQGFIATPGWDPVTGLGSVDFHLLAATCDPTYSDANCPANPNSAFSWKSGFSLVTVFVGLVFSIVTTYF